MKFLPPFKMQSQQEWVSNDEPFKLYFRNRMSRKFISR
jgi:hypothetical protein